MLVFNSVPAPTSTTDVPEESSISFEKLIEMTGMHPGELKKNLISLCMVEHPVLKMAEDDGPTKMKRIESAKERTPVVMQKKRAVAKEIKKENRFYINIDFKSKLRRVQINTLQKKESREDADAVHDKVLNDRKIYVDAAVVKTMKSRKTLKHNDLLAEVLRFLRFPCEVEMINQRIKQLIDKDYMKPDE